jgi:hypothetical protein
MVIWKSQALFKISFFNEIKDLRFVCIFALFISLYKYYSMVFRKSQALFEISFTNEIKDLRFAVV